MTEVKIELQFDRSDVTKDDVYDYLKELMEDDSLDIEWKHGATYSQKMQSELEPIGKEEEN